MTDPTSWRDALAKIPWLEPVLGVLLLAAVSWAVLFAVRRVVLRIVADLVERSSVAWDDALDDHRVFHRLAHLAPALVVYFGLALVPGLGDAAEAVLRRAALGFMIAVVALSLGAFLSAVNVLYMRHPENRSRPVQGYLQLLKIFLYVAAAVLVVATLMDRSPWLFLSGLGAVSAVLILIFRDTLLSLVASVQLTNNDLLHLGDWIEMPQFGADGDVVDVALHTVQVQNWDKTLVAIPTHRFLDTPFKNWRGMTRAGGRRIKRSLHLDVASVRFLRDEEVEAFGRWALLRDYLRRKRDELERANRQAGRDPSINADVRRLTNVGTFRAYVEAYLRAHPAVHQGLTLMVRQLQPGPAGLPIEIYCFTNTTEWARYEGIQADLFDHLLAIVPDFDLRIFQEPSGRDLAALAPSREQRGDVR